MNDEDEQTSYEEETSDAEDEEMRNDLDEELSDDDDEVMSDEDADAYPDPINAEELAGLPREALVARLITAEQLIQGTYYSTIDQVWKGEGRHVARGDSHLFEALKRTRAPSFASPDGANYYDLTISKANDPALRPAEVGRSSTAGSSNPEMRLDIWPRDIFGAEKTEAAHFAHLVPASLDNSTLYFDVAAGALALPQQRLHSHHRQWVTIQKAIHGAIAAPTDTRNASPRRRAPRRRPYTGIKHSVTNLIRLAGQATYFDKNPCVLIVPVLTLDEVRRWNGQSYTAIVMVGKFQPPGRRSVIHLDSICENINMMKEGPTATPEDVEVARVLLSHFVLGMAYSLIHRSSTWVTELSFEQGRRLDECIRVFVENASGGGVVVPRPRSAPGTGPPLRPRLVTFRGADEAVHNNINHLAPDPYLLSVKAAVNWSARHRQPLLAAAEPVEEEEIDELYVLAMEQYLEYYDRTVRPPDCQEELARQLGQPKGFQGEESPRANKRQRVSLAESASSSPALQTASP
jgi:hypothetical protein